MTTLAVTRETRQFFVRMRADAINMGFLGAAEAYGCSAIRMGFELLKVEEDQLRKATNDVLRRGDG